MLANAHDRTTAPDLMLLGGKVITMDAADSVAEAIAIRAGKIAAIGNTADVRKLAGPATRVIDMRGRTVTPGLIDAHLHFADVSPLYSVDLSGAESIRDVQRLVRERVNKTKPSKWITGHGWDEGKLRERRYIQAADLDAVAPHNPVWLTHATGHYAVANSSALRLANIGPDTTDPTSGTIDRDVSGHPTGVLKKAALDLMDKIVPPLRHNQVHDGHLRLMIELNREGITAVEDPGIDAQDWNGYRELLAEKKLTIHLFALWYGGKTLSETKAVLKELERLPKPGRPASNNLLVAGGVKLYMDGSGGARTAWMYDDWNKELKETDTGNKGYPVVEPETHKRQVRAIHEAGIHVSTHAIGDRAIDWVVDTYGEVLKAKPTVGLRHGIIHANIPTDHAIATMAALEKQYDAAYPEVQAGLMWWIGDNYAGNFGPKRNLRLMPLQRYVKNGIKWAGGSDYPVMPFAPRYGLWASVARKTLKSTYGAQPFGTAQAVDVHSALRSYTIWAAHQLFLEDRIGSLEVGKDADLAVWDRDLYQIPAEDLKDIRCEMTVFAGKVVWARAAFR
jgi:predicted amidohydrolase YtcJ